jgi:hypothetical protein
MPARSTPAPEKPPTPRTTADATAGSFRVGLGVIGSVNTAPSAAAGAAVFVGMTWHTLSVDLEGRGDAPVTGDSDLAPIQVRSWLAAGSIVPCLHLGIAFGCAVASVGILSATARNVRSSVDTHGPWSAAGGRAGVEWTLESSLLMRAHVEVLGTLTRDTLWIDETKVYTLPPWSGSAGLAVAWQFR